MSNSGHVHLSTEFVICALSVTLGDNLRHICSLSCYCLEMTPLIPLEQARYISLATWRKNGAEVRTPVWFAKGSGSSLYCFSAANAGKVKRLRHASRSRIATCDFRGGGLGDWINSEAYLVSDSEEIDEAYRLLKQKYGLQMAITNWFSWLSGRINNREVIRIELRPAIEAAQLISDNPITDRTKE